MICSSRCARRWIVFGSASLVALAVAGHARTGRAQGLVYVEGIDQLGGASQNIFRADGGDINTALDPNLSENAQVPGNNIWNYRGEGVPEPLGGFATIYESIQEDSPELRQLITGLAPNTSFDVYVAYWSDATDWGVRAGFASNPNNNTLFNRAGALGGTAGVFAGSGAWTTPPFDNPEDTDDNPSPFINITTLGGTAPAATQNMYLGLVGTTTSSGTGEISVFLDDAPSATDANVRSWFDGLAYVAAGTPVFVTGTLNRDTGNLTINNPTGSVYSIASYSITSAAGALNSTTWDNIAVGGNSTITETHPWTVTAPPTPLASTTELSEAETPAVNGAQLAATTGAFNLGNLWVRTPFQDVQVTLTLTDGSNVGIIPTYAGAAIANGDFNADGAINLADWTIFKTNAHANLTSLTLAQAYQLGDMSQDRVINANDFIAFRNAYDQANGLGAFTAMIASIPEPSTTALATLGLGALHVSRRRRRGAKPQQVEKSRANPATRLRLLHLAALSAFLGGVVGVSPMATAQTVVDVTGVFARAVAAGTEYVVDNTSPGNFTVGDGTANSADDAAVWAALPTPLVFENGQEVSFHGRVDIDMPAVTGDAFRFGLFDGLNFTGTYDPLNDPLAGNIPASVSQGVPNGYKGFLVSAGSGGGPGSFDARNPASTTNASFISTFGYPGSRYQLAGLGPADQTWDHDNNPGTAPQAKTQTPTQLAIQLGASPSIGNFGPGTYDFVLTIGRYGFENTMTARLTSTAVLGDQNADGVVDGQDILVWQRQAPPTTAVLNTIRANFGRSNPAYSLSVTATASPSQDTVPSFITNEVDRVAFLLSNGMNTSQAEFTNVQVELRQIQSLILDVNTATGAVRVRNASGLSFDLTYYEITSVNGNLAPAGWVSLDDGEGGDPDGTGWDELGTASANALSEGNLTGSRLVSDLATFSLGTAYNTATSLGNRDVNFFFTTSDGVIHRGVVNYNTTSPVAAVPEPAGLGMALVALAGLHAGRRRRAKV
jgi:hypothetical protein